MYIILNGLSFKITDQKDIHLRAFIVKINALVKLDYMLLSQSDISI